LSILIADDHPIFRRGLKQLIDAEAAYDVVAEADNGEDALRQIVALSPAIAILDGHMPKMSGLDVARAMRDRGLSSMAVFLTMYKDQEMFNAAIDAGVKGYVLKDSAITEILGCLEAVAAGKPYVTGSLSHYLIDRHTQREAAAAAAAESAITSRLTPAEVRVLRMIASYKTSKEIAGELHIDPRTVDNHRTNIASKLGIRGSHALLKFAVAHRSEIS
jgi:DNA-binding NarL/FixJ family response regulator